jgi:2-oxoglutarate dehydrogenase complex dehydrogenase (E1) component-like enzyme
MGRISGTIKTELFYYCLMDMKDKVQSTRQEEWSYLQLCARQNMFVADCTTPANFFSLVEKANENEVSSHLLFYT